MLEGNSVQQSTGVDCNDGVTCLAKRARECVNVKWGREMRGFVLTFLGVNEISKWG